MSGENPSPRRTRRRLTIRTRLTLTYAGLITGSGAVLITLVYLYMRFVPSYRIVPDQGALRSDVAAFGPTQPTDSIAIASADDFLDNMLISSMIALILMALIGGLVGWLVAGRIVKPLSEIGMAARRAASGALDHRVGLTGPQDEIQDLADTFDTMMSSLERSFASQRRFTANASHELQSPLATIKTMIDVTDPTADAEEYRGLVQRINEINQDNIQTVDALLDLATASNAAVELEPFDLTDMADAVLRRSATDAQVAGVVVDYSREGVPVIVTGDSVLVRHAMSNLVRNAIRHNHPGGTASLRVAAHREHGRITVTNSGPLVSAEALEELVEPFARGGGRSLTRGQGHGLGLAIVHAAVEATGGTLTLAANPQGGLTATVELPLGEHPTQRPSE